MNLVLGLAYSDSRLRVVQTPEDVRIQYRMPQSRSDSPFPLHLHARLSGVARPAADAEFDRRIGPSLLQPGDSPGGIVTRQRLGKHEVHRRGSKQNRFCQDGDFLYNRRAWAMTEPGILKKSVPLGERARLDGR